MTKERNSKLLSNENAILTAIAHQPQGISSAHGPLIAQKIIARHNWSQLCHPLKRFQVIPHPRSNTDLLPTRRRELGCVKSLRLLIQHEDVAVRTARRWRPGTGVVGDEWCITRDELCAAIGALFRLEIWLDP